jgi:hypothetical protein
MHVDSIFSNLELLHIYKICYNIYVLIAERIHAILAHQGLQGPFLCCHACACCSIFFGSSRRLFQISIGQPAFGTLFCCGSHSSSRRCVPPLAACPVLRLQAALFLGPSGQRKKGKTSLLTQKESPSSLQVPLPSHAPLREYGHRPRGS